MNFIKKFINAFKHKLSSQFVRNLSWMSVSEIVPRIVRLGATVIIARYLTPNDYGLGAIILMVNEFTRVFMDVGITTKIIQADEQDLENLCNSAYWLNWIIFSSLFIIQCIVAFPVSWFYQTNQLIFPICVAAVPYLAWPIIGIKFALVQRENKLKIRAISQMLHHSMGNVSCAIFAFLGMGVWAFVLPGLVGVSIDIFIYSTNYFWQPPKKITLKYWKELWAFGKSIFGVALLKTLRNNLDYLIVGRFLGMQELGTYFFGFNAGLGISLSLIYALNSAVLPHLCAVRSDWIQFKKRYWSSLKALCFIVVPLVLLQSSLAPFYVPIVFSQKWVVAVPILILICLSAIPRAFADAATQLLIAAGRPDLDLRWNVLFTGLFTGALLIGIQWQAIGVAISVLVVHAIFLPLFAIWATRYVFSKSAKLTTPS